MPKGTESTIFAAANASSYVWGQQGGVFGRFPTSLFSGNAAGNTTVTNPAFLDLTDVDPTSYANQAGKFVAVNANATGLTFSNATLDRVANCFGVGNATPANTGAGITFPATAAGSTDVNTLDDYEEGTFNPTIKINANTVSDMTYNSANTWGYYTKIGNTVTINGRVTLTSTGTGTASIVDVYGLPFALNANIGSVEMWVRSSSVTCVGQILGQIAAGGTYIRMQAINNGVGAQIDQANGGSSTNYLSNTSTLRFSMFYYV